MKSKLDACSNEKKKKETFQISSLWNTWKDPVFIISHKYPSFHTYLLRANEWNGILIRVSLLFSGSCVSEKEKKKNTRTHYHIQIYESQFQPLYCQKK